MGYNQIDRDNQKKMRYKTWRYIDREIQKKMRYRIGWIVREIKKNEYMMEAIDRQRYRYRYYLD